MAQIILYYYCYWVATSPFEKAKTKLAQAMRRRRAQLKLTQEDAAHAVDMATRHYQKLEAGELNITLRTLTRLVVTLGLDVSEIYKK